MYSVNFVNADKSETTKITFRIEACRFGTWLHFAIYVFRSFSYRPRNIRFHIFGGSTDNEYK